MFGVGRLTGIFLDFLFSSIVFQDTRLVSPFSNQQTGHHQGLLHLPTLFPTSETNLIRRQDSLPVCIQACISSLYQFTKHQTVLEPVAMSDIMGLRVSMSPQCPAHQAAFPKPATQLSFI